LPDQSAEIGPVPTGGGGRKPEPEMDRLSNILKMFNDLFGNIPWKDVDKIRQVISDEIPAKVSADRAYQNAKKNSDRQNARIEHDKALQRVVTDLLTDYTELFRLFSDDPNFKKFLSDSVFWLTYEASADTKAGDISFTATRAALLVQKQFGVEAKWRQVNHAIWEYFAHHRGERIGLSEVKQIASAISVSEDEVFSVLGLLTGPHQDFIRRVYYRRTEAGNEEEVASEEVVRQTRLWWIEKKISEEEWRRWAANVFVGWEPTIGDEKQLSN
jgi:type I restriction enzyme R subunit